MTGRSALWACFVAASTTLVGSPATTTWQPRHDLLSESELGQATGLGEGHSAKETVTCDQFNADPPTLVPAADCDTAIGAQCVNCGVNATGERVAGVPNTPRGWVIAQAGGAVGCSGFNGYKSPCDPLTGKCDFMTGLHYVCGSIKRLEQQSGDVEGGG